MNSTDHNLCSWKRGCLWFPPDPRGVNMCLKLRNNLRWNEVAHHRWTTEWQPCVRQHGCVRPLDLGRAEARHGWDSEAEDRRGPVRRSVLGPVGLGGPTGTSGCLFQPVVVNPFSGLRRLNSVGATPPSDSRPHEGWNYTTYFPGTFGTTPCMGGVGSRVRFDMLKFSAKKLDNGVSNLTKKLSRVATINWQLSTTPNITC